MGRRLLREGGQTSLLKPAECVLRRGRLEEGRRGPLRYQVPRTISPQSLRFSMEDVHRPPSLWVLLPPDEQAKGSGCPCSLGL